MEGVKVAVYVVPEPVKLVSVPPPVTVTFADVKSLVDSLDVNVKLMLASFEIKPLIPSAAVIIIVSGGGGLGGGLGGGVNRFFNSKSLSLNSAAFFLNSVNLFSTSISSF